MKIGDRFCEWMEKYYLKVWSGIVIFGIIQYLINR